MSKESKGDRWLRHYYRRQLCKKNETETDRFCPKCGEKLIIRRHKLFTKKMQRQAQIFTQWDFCKKCKFVGHNEKYKLTIEK